MRRFCTLLSLLMALLYAGPLSAVLVSARPAIEVKPRSFFTLAFTIENDSEQVDNIELRLDLPEGWSSISSLGTIKLAPGQSRKKLISISVPQSASAAHTHSVKLQAGDGEAEVEVYVEAEYGLRLHVLETEAMGWTGETVIHRYEIQNMGNSLERYGISLRGSLFWPIAAPQHTVEVQPGQRLPLEVHISIPADTPSGLRNYITLEVWPLSPDANNEKHLKRHRCTLEAIPTHARDEAVYQSLPSTFELKAFDIGAQRLPKMRPRYTAQGILDDRYLVDIDLSTTAFREFDDSAAFRSEYYRVDVVDPENWGISVGDTRADFSYLTRDVFGKGARVRTFRPSWETTLFYGDGDVSSDIGLEETISAGNITFYFCDARHSLGLTYMATREDARPDSPVGVVPRDTDLVTVQASSEPINDLLISAEAGYGHMKAPNDSQDDYAWWILATYAPECYTLEGEAYHSGSYYFAKLHDRQGYRLYGALRRCDKEFWAEQHNFHNNVDDLPDVQRERTQRTRVGCYVPEVDCWPSVDSNAEYRKELTFADDGLIDENTYLLNLTLHKTYPHSTVTARGRWDYSQEKYTKDHTHLHLYEIACKMNLDLWTLGVGGYLTLSEKTEQGSDNRRVEGWASRPVGAWGTLMGRCALSWRGQEDGGESYAHRAELGYYVTKDRWYVDLRARHNFLTGGDLPSNDDQRATQITGRTVYTIQHGHYIEAYLEFNDPAAQGRDIRTVLSWKKDFQMPVPFVKTRSVLKGQLQLRDPEICSELPPRPLSKIRLSLGDTITYTDSQGNFTFPARDPGPYILDIDRSKLPSSLAIEAEFPMQVILQKGEVRRLKLPVVAVASIGGHVFIDKEQIQERQDEAPGLVDIRISLLRDGKLLRESFTSYNGQYFFHNLPPGHYTLEIDTRYLPERYQVTTANRIDVELHPKERLRHQNFGVYQPPRELKIKRF